MDQIENIRLMMAEQRYLEAQQLIEKNLMINKTHELLGLLIDVYLIQGVQLPYDLCVDYIPNLTDQHQALQLLAHIEKEGVLSRLYSIYAIEKLGNLDVLHTKISDFYLYLYERKIPREFKELKAMRKKYFSYDFNLELRELALLLDIGWSREVENEIQKVIIDTLRGYHVKNRDERLQKLSEFINSIEMTNELKIYQGLLDLFVSGIQSQKDYKKIIESIIYFNGFEFEMVILSCLSKLQLEDICSQYAKYLKNKNDYDFVLIEKYYPHLKKYFLIKKKENVSGDDKVVEGPDLSLDTSYEEIYEISATPMKEESDIDLSVSLKHLNYDFNSWLNLAVGFIQSEFYKSALVCSKKAKSIATTDVEDLKCYYLIIHALLGSDDYRLALDYCYEAIGRSKSQEDLISFNYLEAEILINLGEKESARKILEYIQSIDQSYRLTSKMIKRLDEI